MTSHKFLLLSHFYVTLIAVTPGLLTFFVCFPQALSSVPILFPRSSSLLPSKPRKLSSCPITAALICNHFNDLNNLVHEEREIYGIKDIINCMINNGHILRREAAEMRLESSVTEAWLNIVECPQNRSDCLVIM